MVITLDTSTAEYPRVQWDSTWKGEMWFTEILLLLFECSDGADLRVHEDQAGCGQCGSPVFEATPIAETPGDLSMYEVDYLEQFCRPQSSIEEDECNENSVGYFCPKGKVPEETDVDAPKNPFDGLHYWRCGTVTGNTAKTGFGCKWQT